MLGAHPLVLYKIDNKKYIVTTDIDKIKDKFNLNPINFLVFMFAQRSGM